MPTANELTESQAKVIYSLIKAIEDKCNPNWDWYKNPEWDNYQYRLISYRGFSTSRITGEMLGSKEYETPEYRFPIDFGKHYVLTHRVKPSKDFLEYIGYDPALSK